MRTATFLVLAMQIALAAAEAPVNALKDLPSAPGPHLEKLKSLGDNQWLDLGVPAADPKWGQARGRAWTPKMAFAPDLRGAFLCATGVHGFVKPDGHYMDDLWFYDINAHKWVCLYPGADTKTLKLRLDENGLEVNETGDHIPVSYLSHGYNNMTYSPDHRKYMVIHTQCPWWTKALPQRWDWLDQKDPAVAKKSYGHCGPVIMSAKHPWFWDVSAGKWTRQFIAGNGPGRGRYEGVLEYVPSQKKAHYLYSQGEVWMYDFETGAWTAGPKIKAPIYDNVACFDSKRERIWVGKRDAFGYYDTKAGTWTSVTAKDQPAYLGGGVDANLTYDSVNDILVLNIGKPKDSTQEPGPYIFHPEENAWTRVTPEGAVKFVALNNAFYDPANNLHYYFSAGDSRDNGKMIVYRYKRAQAQK